jgi:hypothetical protein
MPRARWAPLVLFVALQSLLIFIVHERRTLWADEFNLLFTARLPLVEGLLWMQDYSAPLNHLLLRPLLESDAPPAWLLRAPTFVFSIASVVGAWLLVKALFSRRAALIALLFIVLNPVFALYSVQARPYMLFTFFSIASMAAFRSIVQTRPTAWNVTVWIASSILLVYAHYYGFLVIAAQLVFAGVEVVGRRELRFAQWLAGGFAAIGVAALPALWLVSRYVLSGASGAVGWIKRPERTDLLFLRQAGALFGDEILCTVFLAAIAVVVVYGDSGDRRTTGAPTWWSWWCERRSAMLCGLWIGFGLYFLVLVSYTVRPVYVARYGLPCEIPLAAFLGAALARVRIPWQQLLVAALLMLPAARLYQLDLREDARDLPHLVEALRSQNSDQSPVFVGNLPYLPDFRNCEVYGLRYYGYGGADDASLLQMARGRDGEIELRDGSVLPRDRRVFVVTGVGADVVESYLRVEGRPYGRADFGYLALLEIEPAGTRDSSGASTRSSQSSRQ